MGGRMDRRTYFAVKEALTAKEKELINFYEVQWHLRHKVPTIEEVARHIKASQVSVNYYLQRRQVIAGLDKRGIPWRQHTQENLTATQVAAAVTIMNFADTRSNTEKLDQLGINPSQYYAWLNDPQFKNLIDNLADQNLKNIRPTAIGEFTKLVNQGDWQAVKYYLDVTGEFASNNNAPQSEQLLKMIVEIIQKHVKDPELIVAIAQDIKLAAANRTLEVVTSPVSLPAITADAIEDKELTAARKMLGV
jgi:ribosomal protein L31E